MGNTNTLSFSTAKDTAQNFLSRSIIFPSVNTLMGAVIIVNMTGSEGTGGGVTYMATLHVSERFGNVVSVVNSDTSNGITGFSISWSYDGSYLKFTPTYTASSNAFSSAWNYIILTGAFSS